MFLKNHWYVAAESAEVGGAPLGRVMLDEPVVVYRKPDGGVVALEDRCCHRRAPLHKGAVVGDALQCGYHGFTFDAAGVCIAVPGLNGPPPREARVRSYPVCERHRYVFVWMGDPALADPAIVPDLHTHGDAGWAATGERMPVAAHYQLIVDNLVDLQHVAFVHRGTIGTDDSDATLTLDRGDGFVRLTRRAVDVPTTPIYRKQGFAGRCSQTKIITFTPPGNVTIEITTTEMHVAGREPLSSHILIVNAMTPETARSSHYFWASTRDFAIDNEEMTAFFHRETLRAFNEDKDILEAQQACIERDPGAPIVHVPADVGGIQARRMMARLIENEAPAHGVAAQ
jgi:phenylpropionate dioxygenase-like ring-hydroxylating dioxygenase large terminal subunit